MATPIIPPAGLLPAGTWSPSSTETTPVVPPVLLADSLDASTGELASMTTAIHPVDAAIQEAFRTLSGSGAAVQSTGHRFDKIRTKTDRTPRELRDECERIIKPFVTRRDVRLIGIAVGTEAHKYGFDGAAAAVRYRNLHTNREQSQAVGA